MLNHGDYGRNRPSDKHEQHADPSLPPYYAYPAIWGPFSLVGEGAVH